MLCDRCVISVLGGRDACKAETMCDLGTSKMINNWRESLSMIFETQIQIFNKVTQSYHAGKHKLIAILQTLSQIAVCDRGVLPS